MTIEVEIYGRSMEVTDRINDYVTKKISRLDRFLPGIDEARVDLAYVKSARSAADRQVAQITVRGKGYILRSEERADDIFAAVDAALEKMQRRIEFDLYYIEHWSLWLDIRIILLTLATGWGGANAY